MNPPLGMSKSLLFTGLCAALMSATLSNGISLTGFFNHPQHPPKQNPNLTH